MKNILKRCKSWWNENYQGFSLSWPPAINFGKKKKDNTLEYFVYLLEKSNWKKEFVGNDEIWVSEEDNTFQIHIGDKQDEFKEEWTTMYPSKEAYRYPVYLKINNTVIKELFFISLDGLNIFVPIPEREYQNDQPHYFWDTNNLEIKVCKIIGKYYIYKNIKGVAKTSKIEIIN